jgi:hypothetical protein
LANRVPVFGQNLLFVLQGEGKMKDTEVSLELQNQSQSMDVYWCMVVAFQGLLSLGCEFFAFHAVVQK